MLIPALILTAVMLGQSGPDDHALQHEAAVNVRTIFAAKCAACHGSNIPRPKGKFGFVTDLARLRDEPDFLVPGQPDDSEVWVQIDDGKMPPKKSKAGLLTAPEKQTIFDWIKTGAEVPADLAPLTLPPPPAAEARSTFSRAVEFLGKLHLLTLHFPIALLIAAAAGELWAAARRQKAPLPAVRFCLWLGAIAAVVTSALGWLHAVYVEDAPDTLLMLHRWIGTGAGVLAPGVLWLSERDMRAGVRKGLSRWAIVSLAVLVGAAAHFGGLLVHGESFYSF